MLFSQLPVSALFFAIPETNISATAMLLTALKQKAMLIKNMIMEKYNSKPGYFELIFIFFVYGLQIYSKLLIRWNS